jgi:DMSO reductase anchor subunit
MNLELLRLLFDFGLLVLILMVQLIIYPSFQFYTSENLLRWHKKYTLAISFVVIPLMFGQLITSALQLIDERNAYTIGSVILIALVWISTFTQFVPMHHRINNGQAKESLLNQIVKRNWIRTFLWTCIFVWSFLKML